MRITGMRCRRFDMRLKRPIKVASGEISSGGTVLVRLDTDAGLYGLGAPHLQPIGRNIGI